MLDAADVLACDSADCTDLLGAIRKVRSWVDAVEARVTSRMRELYATPTKDRRVMRAPGPVRHDPLPRAPAQPSSLAAYDRRP